MAKADTNPNAPAEAPTTWRSERPPQQHARQRLEQPADDAARKIQRQERLPAQRSFDLPAEYVDGPTVQQQVHPAPVHELVSQQLPGKPVPQPVNA